MAELLTSRNWLMQLAFALLCLAIIFFHLLPLSTLPSRWPAPDLLICFIFAWSLRRPDYVPVLLLAGILLLADLLFQRPPGLMATLVLIGNEYLNKRTGALREASFAGEWFAVALVVTSVTVLNRVLLSLTGVEQTALGTVLLQMLLTIFTYPLAVAVSQSVMGIYKPAPSDTDSQRAIR